MKLPAAPPALHEIFSDPSRISDILRGSEAESTRTDRYLHWDDLRRREPPADLTSQEWWAGLTLRRLSGQQGVPLRARDARPFRFSLTARMFEQLHAIDLKCGGSVEGPEPVTNPETRDRYYVSSLVEEAITSSLLEGAAVTRSVARELLRTGRKPTGTDERMILNNFQTMRRIADWKTQDLTPATVLEIHRTITKGTLENSEDEGRLRSQDDDVRIEDESTGEIVFVPPGADELTGRLEALCEFANDREMRGFLHPVIRSITLHFWLAYDHPFVDGNGRTARALFYWSMLRHGFWLFEFISISQQILREPTKYYRAFLHTETDGNDLNYFLLHQLGVIERAIEDLHTYIQRKSAENHGLQRLLHGLGDFNHRQIALLTHALKHPGANYAVASHRNSHRVATQTARNDLDGLTDLGLLVRHRYGKAFNYRPVPDLDAELESLAHDRRDAPP